MKVRKFWPRGKDGFPQPERFRLRTADGFQVLHDFFEVHPVRRAEFWWQPGKILIERKPCIVELGELGFFFDNGGIGDFVREGSLKGADFLFRWGDHFPKVDDLPTA